MGRGKCTFLFYFYDIFVYYWLSEQSEDPIGMLVFLFEHKFRIVNPIWIKFGGSTDCTWEII